MADPTVLDVYRREVTPELYTEIRELYKTHSIAEDARDLPGLISTLTPDCVYELVQTGHRWEGHEGAARFYTQLLTAFPDIRFDLTDIVIGPQGVCEEADVSATHQAPSLRLLSRRGSRASGPAGGSPSPGGSAARASRSPRGRRRRRCARRSTRACRSASRRTSAPGLRRASCGPRGRRRGRRGGAR